MNLANDVRLTEDQRKASVEFYKTLELMAGAIHRMAGCEALTLSATVALSGPEGKTVPLTLGVTMCVSKESGLRHTRGTAKMIEDSLAQMEAAPEDEPPAKEVTQ